MTPDECPHWAQCSFFVGPTPSDAPVRMFIEAALAAFLLVWCLRSRRDGIWATVASVAALCWTAVTALNFVAEMSARRGALDLYSWVSDRSDALDWLRLASLGVVVLALSVGRTRARNIS